MDFDRHDDLFYTLEHFKEIARSNRFAENAGVPHDVRRCLICHPEKIQMDPFMIYLEVVAQAIPIRRPRLDADLTRVVNEDLILFDRDPVFDAQAFLNGQTEAREAWDFWLRNAIDTGLELLSVHSPSALSFSISDADSTSERKTFLKEKLREITEKIILAS